MWWPDCVLLFSLWSIMVGYLRIAIQHSGLPSSSITSGISDWSRSIYWHKKHGAKHFSQVVLGMSSDSTQLVAQWLRHESWMCVWSLYYLILTSSVFKGTRGKNYSTALSQDRHMLVMLQTLVATFSKQPVGARTNTAWVSIVVQERTHQHHAMWTSIFVSINICMHKHTQNINIKIKNLPQPHPHAP